MALSMLTEGATDETLNELMILLGITSLENNQNQMGLIYNHNYYNNSYGQVRMANSLWINQRRVEEGYIQTLASKYFAESYYTSFNEQGKDNILRWINNYTNNFLHLTKENYDIDSNTALLLLNTIYFNNKWANEFNKADSYVGDFTTLDGIVSANYMKHTVSSVFSKSKNAQTITDTFENKNTIRFILPNEGVAISDLLNPSELFENKLLQADVQATISIPKFHHQKSFLLNDALSSLGASRMFMDVGEFGKINREVFVSFVRQDVGIEFSEKGVKAAAVSSIGMKDSAAEPLETMSINLNRPFIYIIYDSKSVPLFIGIVQNPNLTK
jgi:serine protease inhibitor